MQRTAKITLLALLGWLAVCAAAVVLTTAAAMPVTALGTDAQLESVHLQGMALGNSLCGGGR